MLDLGDNSFFGGGRGGGSGGLLYCKLILRSFVPFFVETLLKIHDLRDRDDIYFIPPS